MEIKDAQICGENCQCDKKIKNLISIVILLAGLFIGSLFVDIGQIIKGSGYSAKNLNKSEIFEASGKTWVAYSEPAVPVTVITDDECEKCDVSEAVVWLRRVMPTVSLENVSYDSPEGKEMIEKYGIKILPAYVFEGEVEKTELFMQAANIFEKKESNYLFKTQDLGMPVGRFLSTPEIKDGDAVFGNKEAKVRMVVYSDFQCPYCKLLYQSVRSVMKEYGDKVAFDYKEMPLDMHAQANNAALASQCALEQGKYWEYADVLYNSQSSWANTKDAAKFKDYARNIGLNGQQFNQCLDDKKYQSKVDADKSEAEGYGITGTPAMFINDQFEDGAVTTDQLKQVLDSKLEQ